MPSLNLCIDIDGTLTDPYYWLELANQYFNKNLRPQDVTEYEIHRVLDIPKDAYQTFYEKHGEEIHRYALLRENVKEIMDLCHLKHNLYYVTARERKMERVTWEWIQGHQLPCDGLYLLGSHYKVDKARELNCDLFLEDNYDNAVQLSAAGFQVLLLDTHYNRLPLTKGVTRVHHWKEISNIVEAVSFEKTA